MERGYFLRKRIRLAFNRFEEGGIGVGSFRKAFFVDK